MVRIAALTLALVLGCSDGEPEPAESPAAPSPATAPAPPPAEANQAPEVEPAEADAPEAEEPESDSLRDRVRAATAEAAGATEDEVDRVIEPIVNSAPTATDEDVEAAMPRSRRPGQPDVACSCNTISFTRECMETSRTGLGEGYRSTEDRCVNGIWSTERPCPVAGRTGTCRITDDQQVVHYYYQTDRHPDPVARAREVCATYRGTFFEPPELTFPLNAR